MSAELHGRIALVTGGAGSVGTHLVRGLAEAGATVLINCFHSYDAAKRLAAELTGHGHRVEVLRASVAKPDQVRRMMDQIERDHGRLDILVNNAAAGTFAAFDDLTEEHLDQAFTTNVKGALWCARAARPLLARSDAGCVVNVSSMGASHAPANYLQVGVSKAALEALTRYLAAEFAAEGTRVNAASAGLIDNPVGRMFPGFDSVRANTLDATPMGRLADPADLADVVLLLASPRSRWITGQVVLADGGLSLLHRAMSPDPEPAPPPAGEPATTENRADPVVVVGMGIAVPGASNPDEFWTLLNEGAELFVDVPPNRWPLHSFYDPDPKAPDKTYQSRSGFITDFRPHPKLTAEDLELEFTARWLRHCAWQALDSVRTGEDDRFSVCVGYTPDGSQHLQESLVRRTLLSTSDSEETLGLAENRLPYGGDGGVTPIPHKIGEAAFHDLVPAGSQLLMVDTACSSSLYAIDIGVRELVSGRADVALCGGAFALAPSGSVLFAKVQGLSRGGAVRALDRSADGVLFSDGAGLVVLKRLSRALADGDRVLGVLAGTGLSADGRGKAIYAPSTGGQELAISRAFEKSGTAGADIDWVIAHATGTPAGDEAEFLALRSAYAGTNPVQVTSNKSLIGHTGWAAGVVSVIHALLALEHGVIPAQHRFTEAPERFELATTNLTIPALPVPWPARPDRPRTAAVSGFGFGGTNAHMLVQEYRPGRPSRFGYGERQAGRPVLVGWSAHLPGADDLAQIADWASGGRDVADSFGPKYPQPPFSKLRLPASTVRATDRTQLMIVECMQRLTDEVRSACDRHKAAVGVVVGHTGPTRNATLYGLRAYLDDLDRGALDGSEQLKLLLKELRESAAELIAAPTEDSFPGEMPNVIAARLCNYFDYRGLNVSVDGGCASLLDAFTTAARYLEFGDIDIALVAGVNGNSLAGLRALTAPDTPIGEGAFLFAVTSRHLAEAEGLPILAELTEEEDR
ncbi:SDR family oxidoreductase [Kutzneria sp. CA-103260]|uniref:SDR family oxidoreductase n=1 Tax=Kutzneria sp. CA-103260 TaxID=2802641 RepID=UPI001BA90473|nr:SDR family oxidoreductase [Kutzneria sp. CA-103260]QUQ63901.1 3-phenylpropionate-dihydrodiol/cinnamic acid-dihydrodiol dehydrogenase [Kutzneria sp. CA-103260]